jgi:hypothetical protein
MDDHDGSFYRSGKFHSNCGDSITYSTWSVSAKIRVKSPGRIPPTAVGGWLKPSLHRQTICSRIPPTAVGGWLKSSLLPVAMGDWRLDLNHPPTAVGGIPGQVSAFVGWTLTILQLPLEGFAELSILNLALMLHVLYRPTPITSSEDFRRDALNRPRRLTAARTRKIYRTPSSIHPRSVRRCGPRSGSAPSYKPVCCLAAAQ